MFITTAKKYFDRTASKPFYERLHKIGLTPNRFTVISLCFKIAALYFFYEGSFILAGVLGGLDYLFDYYDGQMARTLGLATKRGGLLDFVFDRVFRELWIVALAVGGHVPYEIVLPFVAIDAFSYFLRDYAEFQKLKQLDWLFANHKFIFWAAVFSGHMNQILILGAVINGALTLVNFVSLYVLNPPEKRKNA